MPMFCCWLWSLMYVSTELPVLMRKVGSTRSDRAFKDKEHRINLAGKSKQELLDILFEERGYEFMDEMQRWFDILRLDKGTEILGNKGWTEKFRYFPIDQSEMDRAKGGLTQNPGWL